MAPKIVGGAAPSWVGGEGIAALEDAQGVTFDEQVAFLGGDLRLTAAR